MTSTAGPPTPAGWYPDPAGTDQLRWWDGAAWTAHLSPRPTPVPSPAPYVAPTPQFSPQATQMGSNNLYGNYGGGSYGMTMQDATPTRWNTPAIWIIIFLPFVIVALAWLVLPPIVIAVAANPADAGLLGFGDFGTVVVLYAIYIALAYSDRRKLREWGYTNPPSPWWMLLAIVYLILRTSRVRRESGHGIAPLVVYLSFAIGVGILSPVLAGIVAVANAPAGEAAERTVFVRQFTEGLDSHGGNFTLNCPPDFSLAVGSQFTCTATELTNSTTHAIALQVVTGTDGKPTVKLISVTPPITN